MREAQPPLLVQVALSALLHQGLQVVGVLLHPQHHALQHQPHRVDADIMHRA